MPSREFWEGDPWLVRSYQKAHELMNEQRNQEMWLQGLYIHEAVAVVIANAFGKKKGQQPEKYLAKPIRITPLTERERATQAEAAKKKLIADLTMWEKQFKNRIGGEQLGGHD